MVEFSLNLWLNNRRYENHDYFSSRKGSFGCWRNAGNRKGLRRQRPGSSQVDEAGPSSGRTLHRD